LSVISAFSVLGSSSVVAVSAKYCEVMIFKPYLPNPSEPGIRNNSNTHQSADYADLHKLNL
jgi:hypothetical protein